MAIVQISKIQVRSGARDDLPQLATGEIGFCTNTNQVFIGNDPNLYPPANAFATTQTEILTSASRLGAAGQVGAIQYVGTDGSLSGSARLLYDSGNSILTLSVVPNANTSTGSMVVGGSLSVGANAEIFGNLNVRGNITYVNQGSLSISDPQIEINTGNGGGLSNATVISPGVLMYAFTASNASTSQQQFIGWSGNGTWVTNVGNANLINTFVFLSNANFDGNNALNGGTPAPTAAGTLVLTSNSVNAFRVINGGGINVSGNATFANGNVSFTTASGGNTVVNIGGVTFNNGNVVIPNGANITGNFAGNVTLPANANLSAPGGSNNNTQLLYNNNGNIASLSNVTYSAGVLSLDNSALAVGNGTISTTSPSAQLFNTSATTLDIGGAATTVNIGANTGTLTLNNPTITGNGNASVNLFANSTTVSLGGANTTSTTIGGNNSTTRLLGSTLNIGISTSATTISGNTISVGGVGTSNISFNPSIYVQQEANTSTLAVRTTSSFTGAIQANSSVTIGGALQANATALIRGAFTANSTSTLVGDVTANGNVTLNSSSANSLVLAGGARIAGVLNVTNDIVSTTSVETPALIARGGATSSPGTITGYWSLSGGSRLNATYADLAEYYEGDQEYPVGTVLIFGGEKEVTISTQSSDTRVAGVVSNTAAYTMNQECSGYKNLIALQGRVPCRVIGPVAKGTVLVTGDLPGAAQSITESEFKPGVVIGKALEEIRDSSVKTIEVAVGRF